MATTGYSGTPLLKKLGIKPEMKLCILNAPENYADLLETNISKQLVNKKEVPDLVHLFAAHLFIFEKEMKTILKFVPLNTEITIWVSWYKKSSEITTDINEDAIRNFALQHDLVDVKVCAVSELWSGLKLVVPLAKRK